MIYKFKGYDGQIELYQNKIIIKRHGFAHITRGFTLGDKEIYLKSISSIQVKKPGLRAGYIQFVFHGSNEVKGTGIMKAANDENTVMFHGGAEKYQEALELKAQIERLMYQPQTENQSSFDSKADELIKYKQLLDTGAITEDEFLSAKNRLLGDSSIQSEDNPINGSSNAPASYNMQQSHSKKYLRHSMKIWMTVCLSLACLYMLTGIIKQMLARGFSLFCFFGILAIMFFVLAKSPKGNSFIFGKEKGIKKSVFTIFSIFVAVLLFGIIEGTSNNSSVESKNQSSSISNQTNTKDEAENISQESQKTALSDIQTWYENQEFSVSKLLIEYAQSFQDVSNVKISENSFHFGKNSAGLYSCNYTIYFTCEVNGDVCLGEARGFIKYQDSTINWYHFEITRDSDLATIVDQYDESYVQIIEDYYKELEAQYS